MKKITSSFITLFVSSSFLIAGGDIQEPSTYDFIESNIAEKEVKVLPIIKKTPIITQEIIKERVVVAPPIFEGKKDETTSGVYVALGMVATRYATKCDNCDSKKEGVDKTAGVIGRVGYDINQYIGLEARGLATSLSDDGGTVTHVGAFVKPMYPIGKKLNTYALIGIGKTETKKSSLRYTSVTGLAMGVGIEYDLSHDNKKNAKYDRKFDGMADQEKGLGLFADYERLYYKSGSPDLDALSIGLTYDF